MVYNIINLAKNVIQLNLANVVKYVFYLFNAAVTLLDWKWNGDADKTILGDDVLDKGVTVS